MDHPSSISGPDLLQQFRPALPGLLFAVLTLLFGFGLGIVFGADEQVIKSRLQSSAHAVRESVYRGDEAAIRTVLDKSWVYMQRAHLHAGGLGTTAVGLILLLGLINTSRWLMRALSLGLGLGGLGYSVYWLMAGFRAPGLGGTGAARESLDWLAVPSSGAVLIATATVFGLVIAAIVRHPRPRP